VPQGSSTVSMNGRSRLRVSVPRAPCRVTKRDGDDASRGGRRIYCRWVE
jgi:hypothetical protein